MENENNKTCVFCGADENVFTALPVVIKITAEPETAMCIHCIHSMEERMPRNWFRWLKRNDPERWQKIVSNHRHADSYISNVVQQAHGTQSL